MTPAKTPPPCRRSLHPAGWAGDDGCQHQYDLADTTVELAISKGRHTGRVLELRQVTRRKPDRGDTSRQVHILTTRPAGDLPPPASSTG